MRSISFTCKSVRDMPARASVKAGIITVACFTGRFKDYSYRLGVSDWENVEKSFGNPNYNKFELINELCPPELSDDPHCHCIRDRRVDAQINAIEGVMKKVRGEDNKK